MPTHNSMRAVVSVLHTFGTINSKMRSVDLLAQELILAV